MSTVAELRRDIADEIREGRELNSRDDDIASRILDLMRGKVCEGGEGVTE